MQWNVRNKKIKLETGIFSVEELELEDRQTGQPAPHPYNRLLCPDWVNVLPITPDGQAILIKQTRAGSLKDTLEIPGGMVDDGERDTMMAAVRELEEETGLTSMRVLPLGSINPNPAFMANRLHMFLAMQAMPATKRRHFPDEGEQIEVVTVPCSELDSLVRQGKIDSALACLTILLAGKYVNITNS